MSKQILTEYASIVLQVWDGRLEFPQLVSYAEGLQQEGAAALAAVLYQTWLKRNHTRFDTFANYNLAVILFSQGDLDGAQLAYEQAIQLAPAFLQPRFNLGLVLERKGRHDEAIALWHWIEQHASADTPDERTLLISALNNIGRLQESRKQFAAALAAFEKSLLLDPEQADTIHHWLFIREKVCLWPVYEPIGHVRPELMRQSTSALAMLSLSDDPASQLAAARNYAERKLPPNLPALAKPGGYQHDRLRIGYCSSDFCLHPVAMLTVELFELHDRTKFETYGFCWSPEDGSQLRQRVLKSMDHFFRIGGLTDLQAAELIREHEIDILIDLHGQTRGARPTIFAYHPAPIQITYLGLPATTGMPGIDYVIADRFLIPETSAQYYSETPLYMPDIYQVSDRNRLCAPPPTRRSCNLPADAFVFCSFNNNHKITPEIFSVWMSILRRVPKSVLWLLADNPWAQDNLRQQAQNHDISADRLIFATRTSPEAYLARYAIADLFLDTFPFNAGTTANDALWMGLPVLTLSGRSFASRMAGALLTAAGLSELVTENVHDYEALAVALASDPARHRDLRERVGDARVSSPLFDTPRFVRNLEDRLIQLAASLPQ